MDEIEKPKTRVQWLLGNHCNYRCSYCPDLFNKSDTPFPSNELLLEVCKDIIYHYDDLGRDVIFEFIGGEPSLIDSIPEVGERLHNYPTNIILYSNGSADLDWWQRARRFLSEVVISVHQEFCDINHIKKVITLLQSEKELHPVNLKVLFPVTENFDSWDWGVKHLKEFREKYEVGELQPLYSNFGRGNQLLPYSQKQKEEYVKLGGYISETSVQGTHPSFINQTCYIGIDTLTIDSYGNVFRGWCMQGGKIGNIYEMPIKWPKEPIICKKDNCTNGFDRMARKES